jgi:hypothetical protein
MGNAYRRPCAVEAGCSGLPSDNPKLDGGESGNLILRTPFSMISTSYPHCYGVHCTIVS